VNRREFITLLGCVAAARAHAPLAQPRERMRLIGVLMTRDPGYRFPVLHDSHWLFSGCFDQLIELDMTS
jgi:hypothetical protein